MSLLPALFFILLPALPQEPVPDAETPAEVEGEQEAEELTPEKALAMIEAAVKSKQLDLIFIAVQDAGKVPDKKVVKELSKLLKHKDSEVRFETVNALRYNAHDEATNVLLKAKSNKAIIEDERCAEEYYYALGQKGDKKAVKILADNLTKTNRGDKVTRARILSLGRIREVESVEALMGCMVSGSARGRHPQMTEIHTSLTVLTGAEIRMNQDDWIAWWNDNKRGLKLTKQEQELGSRKGRAAWMTLWATPEDKELMEAARKKGKDDFGDANPEELEELRKKAEERKKRAEEKKEEPDDGGEGSDGENTL
ncbi:MAG: hypothetical protein MK209_00720 [Planctomycetes bacterium]|nr:hypothetical protein [Planctomycetota bacterium]